ncbi:MAG: PAS domain-containing sensor histidine kinase [Gammaproteobacteria bacterium]
MPASQLLRSEPPRAAFHGLRIAPTDCDEAPRRAPRDAGGRFAAVFQALPGGVVALDADGRVEAFNPAARELLGDLRCGEPWREVVARAVAPAWDDGHDVTLTGGRRVNIATEPLAGRGGQVLLIKDVSQTRALQDELARYKRLAAEGNLAAALAHQIRTPIAAALLYAGHLGRAALSPARRNQYAGAVVERLRHLERLVEDMLLYARCGGFERTNVPVSGLLAELRSAAAAQSAAGSFRIVLADEAGAAQVPANRDALTSALHNLIANAHEACDGHGTLRIAARRSGPATLEISFTDDGPGIDPAQAGDVFEPFFTTRDAGTGLGLAVVRAIVHAHGGDIRLDTAYQGGARFVISLPLCNPMSA